jgi:hypothetical protein
MSNDNILTLDQLKQGLANAVSENAETQGEQESNPSLSKAIVLRKLCIDSGVTPFCPVNIEGVYARFPRDGHHAIENVRSRRFKSWLSKKFYLNQGAEAKAADLEGAVLLLEADADETPRHEIFTRLASTDGKIYIDLCDDDYRAVEIDGTGWRVISDPPVWFVRPRSMTRIPCPEQGGSLKLLRPFANLSDEDFVLFISWLVSAANPDGPFFVLSISSEHGSGKSSLSTVLKSVIDPNVAMRLSPPKDEDAVFATASSQWVRMRQSCFRRDGYA